MQLFYQCQPLRSPDGMAVWMSTWNTPITTIGGIITATMTDGGTGTHTAGRVEIFNLTSNALEESLALGASVLREAVCCC